jgi:hypothetical protein
MCNNEHDKECECPKCGGRYNDYPASAYQEVCARLKLAQAEILALKTKLGESDTVEALFIQECPGGWMSFPKNISYKIVIPSSNRLAIWFRGHQIFAVKHYDYEETLGSEQHSCLQTPSPPNRSPKLTRLGMKVPSRCSVPASSAIVSPGPFGLGQR